MRQKKIGIFGGSFNPIHTGHLIMAQDAADAFGLDRVIFVPAAIPPHKLTQTLVTPEQRLNMVRLALSDHQSWEISDEEVKRGGVSFSVETVRHFKVVHPEAEIFFIIGGDTLPELHTWREIESLLGLCKVITMVRPGFDPQTLKNRNLNLPARHVDDLISRVTVGHVIGISSTEVRMRVAQNKPIRYLVPDAVVRYIHDHMLYRK